MGILNHIFSRVRFPQYFFHFTGSECSPAILVDLTNVSGIVGAYERCSTLKTVVNRNAAALSVGRFWLVDDKDNDVSDKYKDIDRLLKEPNPIQTFSEFVAQADVYRQLFGHFFIYASRPEGFGNESASSLWVLRPDMVEIKYSGSLYNQSSIEDIIERVWILDYKSRMEVDPSQILHVRDRNQNLGFSRNDLKGASRLTGLSNVVRNIIQAEEAIYALNKDRGAMGILSSDENNPLGNAPVTEEEKDALQKQFNSMYGLRSSQWKVILSNARMKWTPMTFNVKDLMLFEGIENNIRQIADALDYPVDLLGMNSGSTYQNKLEAKKSMYQDSIIPTAKLYAQKLTKFFGIENVSVIEDYSEVECLKTSQTEEATRLLWQNQAMKVAYEAGAVSLAEWRLSIGMDENIYKPDNK